MSVVCENSFVCAYVLFKIFLKKNLLRYILGTENCVCVRACVCACVRVCVCPRARALALCDATRMTIHSSSCVNMNACMYVCICVCMHVCMHLCMMYACMHVCMYTCMHVCMHACMHVCMYVCMYACTYVCVYNCDMTRMTNLPYASTIRMVCVAHVPFLCVNLHTHTYTHT